MKEKIYRVLNIKHSESSQVFDLLTVQFFIGLANALVNIIAFTLFIYNFPIQSLPIVYLVVAGVLIVLNLIYEKLEHIFSPIQLLKYVTGFAAFIHIVFWLGLSFINKTDFIFIMLVASVAIYMVTGYAFWGLVSLLFNVRESRRVFSIVGSGDIPAKILGYLLGPLLIPFVGINNLIWLAIGSFFVGLFLFARFTRKKSWDTIKKRSHEEHHQDDVVKKHDIVSFVFKDKLIFAISLLSILSYNVFVLVDFTFISQVKLRFENIADLATYIAIFFAFGRVIALVFKLIFTSRVIERLGVIYCLFVTPVALFLFCMLFFIYGGDSNYNLFIFGLMAMLTEVLRSTMQEPVFFILFQPLKENLRLKGHMISKGYMYPPSLLVVGLSLLFLNKAGVQITILMAIKVVIVNLCIWVAIIYFIRKTYLDTIHSSIKKGIFYSDDIYVTDQKTIDILLQKIKTNKKNEVIYSLNLLEKSDYPGLNGLLEQQLKPEVALEIKEYALNRMEKSGNLDLAVLKKMLDEEHDIEIKRKLFHMLCKYDSTFLDAVSKNIGSYEYEIRKIIIVSLLNQGEFNFLFKAGTEINNLLHSVNPVERGVAADIIGDLKNIHFSSEILSLINDQDLSVKRIAITTVCKLKMQQLLPSVISLLDHTEDKNIVIKGLHLYGDTLFKNTSQLPVKHLVDFIKIASKMKGEHSTRFLISKLGDISLSENDKILHALWVKEFEPNNPEQVKKFSELLNEYLKKGQDKISDYNFLPEFHDQELIKNTIYNEVKNDLSVALKTSVLLFKKKEINRILELLEMAKQDKLYNAMEMLELLLPKKISNDLNLLFDFILDPKQNKTNGIKPDKNVFFNKVLFDAPHLYNPWTKSICVYTSWKNNEVELLNRFNVSVNPYEHFLVKETRDFVLNTKHIML